VTRKVSAAMLETTGFSNGCVVGAGEYRTSGHTQATFYIARKPPIDPRHSPQ